MNAEKLMHSLPTDAALICSQQARRYFTGFDCSDGFLAVTKNKALFLTDGRYIEAASGAISGMQVALGTKAHETLAVFFQSEGVKTLALEAEQLTVMQLSRLSARRELSFVQLVCDGSLDKIIEDFMAVKSAEERELVVSAQRIAERAFEHILGFIKTGRTEREIALELDYYMLSHGAQALSFETIAVSGKNSSMPHGVPSDKKIEKGDFVTLDFGAVVNGYHSDMTRTVAVGGADSEQRHVYETVLSAQRAALESLAAGVNCSFADKAARTVIENNGYGKFFSHSTGHGVGLRIHEKPNLSPSSEGVLAAGNIVTVEPRIYMPGRFGVRIEDMAYITEGGCENLTRADKSLIIL